jgi:hypothetical protein
MTTINITAHAENDSQIQAVKAVMKALKIKFTISKETPYDPEFVAKIEESRKQSKEGKVSRVNQEDLKHLMGL